MKLKSSCLDIIRYTVRREDLQYLVCRFLSQGGCGAHVKQDLWCCSAQMLCFRRCLLMFMPLLGCIHCDIVYLPSLCLQTVLSAVNKHEQYRLSAMMVHLDRHATFGCMA